MSEPAEASSCGPAAPAPAPGTRDRFLPVTSWALYDLANTVYSGIVVTFFLPLYLTYELGHSRSVLGLATTLSLLAAGLVSPFLGCIPDRTGRTKRYLLVVTGLCVACTGAISGFASPLALVLAIYFVSNVLYQVAMVFYDALLPTVASPAKQGSASGWGVALGYIGVILALLVAKNFILQVETGDAASQLSAWKLQGLNDRNSTGGEVRAALTKVSEGGKTSYRVDLFRGPERAPSSRVASARSDPGAEPPLRLEFKPCLEEHPLKGSVTLDRYAGDAADIRVKETYRWVFAVAAALFLLFTIPLAIFVPERAVARAQRLTFAVAASGFRGVLATLRALPAHRNLLLFIVGNFLCVDVLNTAIQWFSAYFTGVFAFTSDEVIFLGLGISSAAFAAGLIMGKATDWTGARRAMLAAAILLSLAVACVAFAPSAAFAVACIVGPGALGLAGLWVAGRKLLIELAPPEKLGEYFGLYGIAIKISVVGTTVFGVISDQLARFPSLSVGGWHFRIAILVQLALILPGMLLLWRIRTPAAQPAPAGAPPDAAPRDGGVANQEDRRRRG